MVSIHIAGICSVLFSLAMVAANWWHIGVAVPWGQPAVLRSLVLGLLFMMSVVFVGVEIFLRLATDLPVSAEILNLPLAPRLRDVYAAIIDSERFRIACGRISASYSW